MGEKSIGGFSSVEELREAIAAWCGCSPDEVPFTDVMGVPITFLDKYCPEQFRIVGATESEGRGFANGLWHESSGIAQPCVFGERKYKRLFIQKIWCA